MTITSVLYKAERQEKGKRKEELFFFVCLFVSQDEFFAHASINSVDKDC